MNKAKEFLKKLKNECFGDYVFIVECFGEIVKISEPCTYRDDALRLYNDFLNNTNNLNYKVYIKQLV